MIQNIKAEFVPNLGEGKQLYIETYGCQMNRGDSEVVVSILKEHGYQYTEDIAHADIILVNTCSVRDNAEQRIWGRLNEFKVYKKRKRSLLVGVIGCMAERLKDELIEREPIVDIVVGPDAYRDLPRLLSDAASGTRGVNVILSREETYAEISPIRLDKNGVSAFVSIMRGCDNMCSYCVVPFTRGRERSRDPQTIMTEVRDLFERGYKEVTLLGQNVNSYKFGDVGFPELMAMVAQVSPQLRVRFATSHPKDLSDKLIECIAQYPNICRAIHLPAQSGSNRMLELMNRKYTREWYLDRINAIRKAIPDCAITTDLIAGFCTETEEDHQDTLSLMTEVEYASAFMFKYSERPQAYAARKMVDDVPEQEKIRRLNEIIELQNHLSLENNKKDIGKEFEVLVEGESKRDKEYLCGRTSQNKMAVFPGKGYKAGDYVKVYVDDCSAATLIAHILE